MTALSLRRPALRWALVAIAATALLLAVERWGDALFHPRPAFRPAAPSTGAPLDYPSALARADQRIDAARQQLQVQGDQWLVQERLAGGLIARARLTGSFDDYAAAQAALEAAFATAPKGSGPHMSQASLAFTLHRLDQAAAMIDAIDRYAVPADADTAAELSAVRGDIAFYRGRYADALTAYRARSEAESAYRLAVYDSKTGQPAKALERLEAIERTAKLPAAQFLANLALFRGMIELQRGQWDAATAQFEHADQVFPGNWLTQAHLAQMLALGGKRAEAIQRYARIAAAGDRPEVMDALASVYRAQGDAANAEVWAGRAGAAWARRLEQLPEAAYGHAVEHELAFGDPRRALDLAQRDFAARPYGATAVALAWALIANNRPADALAALKPVDGSAWVSAEQHLAAAQAYALTGQSEAADAAQLKALAINPRANDPAATLVWFGH